MRALPDVRSSSISKPNDMDSEAVRLDRGGADPGSVDGNVVVLSLPRP